MSNSSRSNSASKLAALGLIFHQQLPSKIAEMESLSILLQSSTTVEGSELADLHRLAHSLAGTSGTFGAMAVSGIAREIEQVIKPQLEQTNSSLADLVQQQISRLLVQLKQAGDLWQPSLMPNMDPPFSPSTKVSDQPNLIYLAEDDAFLAKDLIIRLEQAQYEVEHFTELDGFARACEKQMPTAIIMDLVFREGGVAGAEIISRLKQKWLGCPPVIFISLRDDITARLAAAKAGARRYFCKPLNTKKLLQTLEGLTQRIAFSPYRVLLIDDDDISLTCYSTILEDAGVTVKTLSDPLESLIVMREFKPDIVLLDVYMPQCSGFELAQVIRQDDAWALMPIVFLSAESAISNQLVGIDLGGDDFLVKPVDASHLVTTVLARAKRARWSHRLNRELMEARETAEAANSAKSTFLTHMSHELRTPLNAILGFGQLLKLDRNHNLLPAQQNSVDEILKGGEHLLELINEVLELAKIETGNVKFSLQPVSLDKVLNESLTLIMPLAQQRGIQISLLHNGEGIELDSERQQLGVVRADFTRLKQALLNLLSNAVKYNSENGQIIIVCEQRNESLIRISISDTGAGLTESQQAQLFTVFNRLGAEQTDIEGSGIGLVICKHIVELMGGHIGVDSQPGQGCTFWLEFLPDSSMQNVPEEVSDDDLSAEVVTDNPEHIYTVLYIEDNLANVQLIAELFNAQPHLQLLSAAEPLSGILKAVQYKPDLILLDINLPRMSGYEVLKRLYLQKETRHIPVIAVSANAMPSDVARGLAAGFAHYITKPVNLLALLNAIDTTLPQNTN